MRYDVKVYRASEGASSLVLSASSVAEAKKQAEQDGFHVISVRQRASWNVALGRSNRAFSVALFSQELLALLEAGLGLVEAIGILGRKARRQESRVIVEQIAQCLREGLSFSRALEAVPDAFPPLYVATIQSSERTGDLVTALRRYLAYDQQIKLVRDKVVAASVYPLLLVTVGIVVVLFLLGYVVPRFSKVYEDLGDNLPWMSRLLMQWGQFVSEYGHALGMALVLGVVSFAYCLSRFSVRAALVRAVWGIPAIGEKLHLYQLARFTRTLAMLVNGGIPFVTALNLVSGLLRQPALRQGLEYAEQSIREGRSVSDAFAANGLATEVGVRLIAVGERSGSLGDALDRIAKLYDDEISRWVDWFTRLFEPVLMIGIGSIIGLIVLLMYLPIFELANSIQ
jgi:general secretion pathway protein F